jgi:hypothetical protein
MIQNNQASLKALMEMYGKACDPTSMLAFFVRITGRFASDSAVIIYSISTPPQYDLIVH